MSRSGRTSGSTEHVRRLIEMQIEQTDRGIDALVHDLDGFSPDEIAVVGASVGKNG